MTVTSSSCKLHPRGVVYHAECSTARAIYVDSVLLNTLVTNLRGPTKVEFSDTVTSAQLLARVSSFHEGPKGKTFSEILEVNKTTAAIFLQIKQKRVYVYISPRELGEAILFESLPESRVETETNYLTNLLKRKPRSMFANYRCAFCM